MKLFKIFRNLLIVLLITVFSCSKNETGQVELETEVQITALGITAATQSIEKNYSAQLAVAITPGNATNKTVVWSSSNDTIATVDANGVLTAHEVGEVIITAWSKENISIVDTLTFTISGKTTNDITLVKINGNRGVIQGNKITFTFLEGSNVTALSPTIVHNGASIAPKNRAEQDFTEPVIYEVISENGDTRQWEMAIVFKPIPKTGSEFITTWKTDLPGASEDNQITIPTFSDFEYYYRVDWGDGTFDSGVTGDIVHTYGSAGTYSVSITGQFPAIYFANPFNNTDGDDNKILSIDQWGTNKWKSMTNAFAGCDNLDMLAYDIPDFSMGLATNFMFATCTSLIGNTSMNFWDVSAVINMNLMFDTNPLFNQDISRWDVSAADGLNAMFSGCTSFNQNIGSWDVSNVENFGSMFSDASSFNQDIGNWDVGRATSMNGMFIRASSFNQDIGDWKVENVDDMTLMFAHATAFDQNLENWNIAQVLYMSGIFNDTSLSIENYDSILKGWSSLDLLQSGVRMGAEKIGYCQNGSERQKLIDVYGWIITDGGKTCD